MLAKTGGCGSDISTWEYRRRFTQEAFRVNLFIGELTEDCLDEIQRAIKEAPCLGSTREPVQYALTMAGQQGRD